MRIVTKVLAAVGAAILLAGCAAAPGETAKLPGAEIGIQVLGVELLADGDIARLNYRVVDIKIARTAFDHEVRLSPSDGHRTLDIMQAGRLGPLRQRPSATGKKQFILFPNNGRVLTRGSEAILLVGDARITGIPVS